MHRLLSKSISFKNPSFTFLCSSNSFDTRLWNSSPSTSISPNTKISHGSPQELSNSTSSNGFSGIQHFSHNPSFSVFQNGFTQPFSSGYCLKFASLRNFDGERSGILRNQGFGTQSRSVCSEPDRESIEYDVVIVGAGPAGLSAAIRLKQLCREKDVDLSVCVVEKGAEVGAHIISGNVFEPRALNELLPQWKQEESPITVPVSSDKFWFLTKNRALSLPCPFDNKGSYVISLSQLVRWMGAKAEELGVEIYPGFAASEILYDANDFVVGIGTNDMGIAKDGSKKENFQRGVELKGRIMLLSEGCRGSLSEKIIKKYNLRENGHSQHQTYALGIKEVWEIDESKHHPGFVLHTLGWPLDQKTYGGSFMYHMNDRQVSIGLVVALNYRNPFLNPYEEFQVREMEKWKEGKPSEARAALRRSVREIGLDVAEQSGEVTRSVSGPVLPRKNYENADIHVERQLMPRVLAGTNGPTDWNEALDIISFGSPEQSVEGMKVVCHELTQTTNDPEGSAMDELIKDADRLVSCLANKVAKTFDFSLTGASSRSCKYVLNTLMQTFQNKRLAYAVKESTLDSLITELLLWLLDERVPHMDDGSQLLFASNSHAPFI